MEGLLRMLIYNSYRTGPVFLVCLLQELRWKKVDFELSSMVLLACKNKKSGWDGVMGWVSDQAF